MIDGAVCCYHLDLPLLLCHCFLSSLISLDCVYVVIFSFRVPNYSPISMKHAFYRARLVRVLEKEAVRILLDAYVYEEKYYRITLKISNCHVTSHD